MDLTENLMLKGAMKLARDCGGVGPEDIVAVVCDYESFTVANQVARACLMLGACTNMIVFEPTQRHGAPPPAMVGPAMEKATAAFLVTTKSMSHTQAVKSARAAGCRIITMPEVYPHMLVHGAVEADFVERAKVAARLRDMLTRTKRARIQCAETGTDVTLDLSGRTGRSVDGIATKPGSFAAPPNIEACIAPVETNTNGVYVVNASIAGVGLITSPVRLTITDGVITAIEGGPDAENLRQILTRPNDPNCFRIAELGMGLNPCAIPCGSLLEDEAPLGTVHLAAGNNASNFPGGQISAPVHIDMIAKGATVTLDDTIVIKNGEFLESAVI